MKTLPQTALLSLPHKRFFFSIRYKQNLVIGKVRLNLTMLDSEKVTVAIWGDGIGLFDKPNQIELREFTSKRLCENDQVV